MVKKMLTDHNYLQNNGNQYSINKCMNLKLTEL